MGLFLRDPQEPAVAPPAPTRNRHRAQSAPYNAQRAITASAERITTTSMANTQRPYAAWQADAWTAYERVGEIHFGFNLLCNLMSRIRFYGASIGEANEAPTDVMSDQADVDQVLAADVTELVADLFAVDAPGMIRTSALNLCVPGEHYLLQMPATPSTPQHWAIRSVSEVQVRPGGAAIVSSRTSGREMVTLPADTYIARIWRRHPQYSMEPDSSLLAVADSVEELLMLQRLVRSATRSRLNAGLLFVPEGIASGINPRTTAEPPIDEPADPLSALRAQSVEDPSGKFLSDLMESMTTPISDEGSASAVVPMLAVGAGDLGAQIRHITFARESDQWLVSRTESLIERILQGLDMPKEIVTGMQRVRFSNAVNIDESMYKANIEPLALVIADAFTSVYLRPMLKARGYTPEQVASVTIWYDPAEIVTRPNSADEATQGLDRGLVSGRAWRREHGYPETDAPSEEEQAQLLLSKIAVLPDTAIIELLRKSYPKVFANLENVPTAPAVPSAGGDSGPHLGGEGKTVVQFPSQQHDAQPAADKARAAIKQVGN
jgi:hypothetical protein